MTKTYDYTIPFPEFGQDSQEIRLTCDAYKGRKRSVSAIDVIQSVHPSTGEVDPPSGGEEFLNPVERRDLFNTLINRVNETTAGQPGGLIFRSNFQPKKGESR